MKNKKIAIIEINGNICKPDAVIDDINLNRSNTMDYNRFKKILNDKLRDKNGCEEIKIIIRSAGGDVEEAIMIYEELCSINDVRITTYCKGNVASAATIIAQAGHHRIISENSLYMIHESMATIEGNKKMLGRMIEVMGVVDEKISGIYAQRSGRAAEYFENIMSEDDGRGKWMSAQDVLDIGLVDEIKRESRWDRLKDNIRCAFESKSLAGNANICAARTDHMAEYKENDKIGDWQCDKLERNQEGGNIVEDQNTENKGMGCKIISCDEARTQGENGCEKHENKIKSQGLELKDKEEKIMIRNQSINHRQNMHEKKMNANTNNQTDAGPSRTKIIEDPCLGDVKINGNSLAYEQDVEMFRG